MRAWPIALMLVPLLAGCSDPKTDSAETPQDLSEGQGRICGVIVDEAIRPIPEARAVVVRTDGTNVTVVSDETGRFCFDLIPGTYVVHVDHLLYAPATTTFTIEADQEMPLLKLQLTRRFTEDAYTQAFEFDGFIQCGYAISGVMSSLCANDYTRFLPVVGSDPKCPQCEHLLGDNRGTDFAVESGWQTMVFEMFFKPSSQATSQEMTLTVSHTPRPASHWYAQGGGASPVLVRMDQGVVHENHQSDPDLVPPEGMPNMHMFAAVRPAGSPAAATFQQQFRVIVHQFYYGSPPEGWSFANGDEPPF